MIDHLLWQSLLLGVVEGLTEFLPVSSTGHLILLTDILNFSGPPGKVFEITIQLGAILAVCWLYRQKLWQLMRHINQPSSQNFILNLGLGFLPSALIGLAAHGLIKNYLFSPLVVSCMLVIGGLAIIAIEKFRPAPTTHHIDAIGWKLALKIGFCQCLALIPGTSRSGATIMGALLLGLERKAAAEFSFFLAIPTMFAATCYDLYKNWSLLQPDNLMVIALGFLAAFITALFVVKTVIRFISRHGFIPFAWYRIALGLTMLTLLVK